MRLICPNCGAQYDVADDVIPKDGRDVQCSNCGNTWFERPGASSIEDAFSDYEDETPPAPPTPPQQNIISDTTPPDVTPARPVTPPIAPARQEMDPAIADILREEAAREAESRRIEAEAAVESQPDLGLDNISAPDVQPDQREVETQRRMATLKGEDVSANIAAATSSAASRKELLPDIEEINSSLRSESERTDGSPAPVEPVKKSRGFRTGFLSVLVILLIGLLLYIFAPTIAEAVPALTSPLDSYVAFVDEIRLWIDLKMQDMLAAMNADSDAATTASE